MVIYHPSRTCRRPALLILLFFDGCLSVLGTCISNLTRAQQIAKRGSRHTIPETFKVSLDRTQKSDVSEGVPQQEDDLD